MSDVVFEAREVARSYDVFTNPASYKGFDLTNDAMRIVGCIDPRDEHMPDDGPLKVIMQTGGGAAGRGVDAVYSLTASEGADLYTLEQGLEYDSDLQRTTVAGAHKNTCRFISGLGLVAGEMRNPSDFTQDTVQSFIGRYGLQNMGIEERVVKISDAANRTFDAVAAVNPDALLDTINGLYPYHPNVRDMKGDNRAGFYILNHHPHIGLDRTLVHRGDHPLTVHAYHDSLRAMQDSLAGTLGMTREVKDLRLASLLLRTAATRTVLYEDNRALKLLNVVGTKRGVEIHEEFR